MRISTLLSCSTVWPKAVAAFRTTEVRASTTYIEECRGIIDPGLRNARSNITIRSCGELARAFSGRRRLFCAGEDAQNKPWRTWRCNRKPLRCTRFGRAPKVVHEGRAPAEPRN